MAKRLRTKSIDTNPRSIISIIPQLKKGSIKYHVLNTSLQIVYSDPVVVKNLEGIVGCAIACFSTQFIVSSLQQLIANKIPFIGCYYSYENLKPENCIIDQENIQMKCIDKTTARVKWGSDDPYTEPIIRKKDIPDSITSFKAIEVIDFLYDSKTSAAYRACSSVTILIF